MKWEPWIEYNNRSFIERLNDVSSLPIEEPPCKHCKWWQPKRLAYYTKGCRSPIFDSVRMCWSDIMSCDFSCFEEDSDDEESY